MKTPVRTRLLSALLSLVMLVSLLPVSVFAAEPEAGTWTKVELADITADDTVAITMTKGDSTWVLPNNGDAKAAAKAITGTVSGNTLTTSEKDLFGWKVVKGADSFRWSPPPPASTCIPPAATTASARVPAKTATGWWTRSPAI